MTIEWNLECRQHMVTALLECACMQHHRDDVVNDLPQEVKNIIKRDNAAKADVKKILETCLNYPAGLHHLFKIIKFYDNNSDSYERILQVQLNINLYQLCHELEQSFLHEAFHASLPRYRPDDFTWDNQEGHFLWAMLDHLWGLTPYNQTHPLLTFADHLRQQCHPVAAKLGQWQAQVAKQLGLPANTLSLIQVKPKSPEPLYLQIKLIPDGDNINRKGAARDKPHFVQLWLWQGNKLQERLNDDAKAIAQPFVILPQLLQQALKIINTRYLELTASLTMEFVLPRELLLEAVEHENISSSVGSGRKIGKHYQAVVRSWERLEYPDLWDTWRRRWRGFTQHATASQLCSQPNEDWTEFFEALPDKTTSLGVTFVPPATVTDPDFFYQLLNAGVPVAIWPRCLPDDITELTQQLHTLLHHQRLAELPALFYEERKRAKKGDVMNDLTLLWDCCDRLLELPTMS